MLPRLVYASNVYPTCSSNFMSCKTNALIIFFYILIFWLLQNSKKKMKSTRYKFQREISKFMKCCWDKKLCTGRSKQNQFLKIKNNIKFINLLQICDPELYCSLKIEYVLLIFNGCLKWMIKQILNLKQGIRLMCNLHLKF